MNTSTMKSKGVVVQWVSPTVLKPCKVWESLGQRWKGRPIFWIGCSTSQSNLICFTIIVFLCLLSCFYSINHGSHHHEEIIAYQKAFEKYVISLHSVFIDHRNPFMGRTKDLLNINTKDIMVKSWKNLFLQCNIMETHSIIHMCWAWQSVTQANTPIKFPKVVYCQMISSKLWKCKAKARTANALAYWKRTNTNLYRALLLSGQTYPINCSCITGM